jgi:site-specific DNA-methyltransferase (adenine-specific)
MIKEFEKGKLYKGDCLEIMRREIADKSIDLILCDLPYGTTQNKWDSVIPFAPLWEQYERIIKDSGAIVLTAHQLFTSKLMLSNEKLFKYTWVWKKGNNPTGFLNAKKQPLRITEDIVVFYKKQCTYNPQMTLGAKSHSRGKAYNKSSENYGSYKVVDTEGDLKYPQNIIDIAKEKNTFHPTQKPISLMEYCIRTYTNENMVVLDNCSGSGTTGIAAINTNRNFILIEQDDNYFELSSKRIEDHIENQRNSLF